MKRGAPGCYAGDCPALDGGPSSIPHENRWSPAGQTVKSEAKNNGPAETNATIKSKAENG
jgi:hypothetical protein